VIMIRELEIHEVFVKYLILNGYPEKSIVVSPVFDHLGRKYRPDFVIVDPDSNKPLAIFEVKNIRKDNSLKDVTQQLYSYARAIKIPDVPLFAAFPTIINKEIQFEIYSIKTPSEEKEIEPEKIDNPPVYSLLKNSRLTEELSKISEDQEKTADNFTNVCWGLAFLVSLFLIVDFLNIYRIDLQRLGLIGVFIGLIILPFANKLKVLGFEFERLSQSKKGKEEK
jgi:hypothetical protein